MSDTTVSSIPDVLARFLLALDDHDWDGVTAALGETVRRDYTSLFGGEPDDLSGAALTAEWRGVLAGLDGHQHLLGMPAVDVEDDEARAAVPVIGTHVLEGDSGSPWVVGGTYRFALRRVDGRWRIVAITLDTRWQTGDAAVLQRAATRARAPR
jgi:SnoaL-like domain